MTWVTPTPTSPSAGVPATKFGSAIGNGAKSPSVMVMRFCAYAPWSGSVAAAPSAAIPEMICRRLGRNSGAHNLALSVIVHFGLDKRGARARSERSLLEDRRECLPFVEKRRRQIIRLALDDRAQRAFRVRAGI